jgi:hypothetical protein
MRHGGLVVGFGIVLSAAIGVAQDGPYKVQKTAKVGGAGGFDYVHADPVNRRLYIPRSGQGARVTVFNLDTLEPVGEIPNVNARGAVIDSASNHGFSSSRPVAMWDAKTLAVIKTIEVQGNPDGIAAEFGPRGRRAAGRPRHALRDDSRFVLDSRRRQVDAGDRDPGGRQ